MASLSVGRLSRAQVALLRTLTRVAGGRRHPALVGGAVRDCRLGRTTPADLDVAIESGALETARQVAERTGGAFVPLDRERGTARVVAGTFHVDLSDFRGPTLEADLAARDYTVNALAVPLRPLLRTGRARIVDPTGGLADLAARRLRLPDPSVLADDPARGLRGVRLEASLGLRLTAGSVAAIRAAAPELARVSSERVRDELLLLLALPTAARALRRADALRLLAVILPEAEAMRGCRQPAPHRFDVLEQSLRALAGADRLLTRLRALGPVGEELVTHLAEELGGGVTRGSVLKLAALLHDVAKPETRREVDGRIRFFEHDRAGAARARAIGERWRLPARAVAVLERLVREHLRPMHLGSAVRVTRRARYRFYRDLGDDARDLLLLALVDAAAVTGASPLAVWRQASLIRELFGGVAAQAAAEAAPPLLRGGDVMARFDLAPGPEVGRLLARAREAQALGRVRTREEALAYLDSVGRRP